MSYFLLKYFTFEEVQVLSHNNIKAFLDIHPLLSMKFCILWKFKKNDLNLITTNNNEGNTTLNYSVKLLSEHESHYRLRKAKEVAESKMLSY